MQNLKLFSMDSVQAEQVKWLWHPYIPLGKITIIQGDPGEGKTTFALALVAALTQGTLNVGPANRWKWTGRARQWKSRTT